MNDFDEDLGDWKTDLMPDPEWVQVLKEIKESKKVCFYSGRNGQVPGFENFIGALSLLGDCDALIYSEPEHSEVEIAQMLKSYANRPPLSIPGLGSMTEVEFTISDAQKGSDRVNLFGGAVEWVPQEEKSHADRFWAEYCRLTISDRKVHVLYIGLAGDAAWAHFLQPKDIRPAKIIAYQTTRIVVNPPWA